MKKTLNLLMLLVILCSVFMLCISADKPVTEYYIDSHAIQDGCIQQSERGYVSDLQFFSVGSSSLNLAEIEAAITEGWSNQTEKIMLSEFNIPQSDFNYIYTSIMDKNPEYFYIRGNGTPFGTSSGIISYVKPIYTFTPDELETALPEFNLGLQRVFETIDDSMTDLEKVIAFHDYLVLNAEYDMETYETSNMLHKTSFSAYGVLVEGIGVCQSYTLAMGLLCKLENIEYTTVESNELVHIWNLVKLDGEWYHIDVTWDDPMFDKLDFTWDAPMSDFLGLTQYSNLLKTDAEFMTENGACDHYATDWVKGDSTAIADSDIYSNAFWTSALANMTRYNGYYYYYYKNDAATPTTWWLVRSTINNINEHEDLVEVSSFWYTDDKNYIKTSLSATIPFVYGDELYYNDVSTIYRWDGTVGKPVYTFFDTGIAKKESGFIMPIQFSPNTEPAFARVTKADRTAASYYIYSVIASPFISGDVNMDGTINSIDIFTLSRYLNSWKGYPDITFRGNCDINNDGFVNTDDIKALATLIIV